jgi:inorganic pyrophosphatase/exopolyphosphatase
MSDFDTDLVNIEEEVASAQVAPAEESHEVKMTVKKTTVEREADKRREKAHEYVSHLPAEFSVKEYMPSQLSGAIFCGHLVTDLDSIAGAIGAAELYGGVPARASEINSETAFALQHWGVEQPRPIEELLVELPEAGVCLVDHQQTSQLNGSIEVQRIVGVIDHHALQNATIVTDMPIYIDIRPWGSMSSIIAHTFLTLRKRPRRATAGLLLCAILSDTLNLQSPTTTEWDRLMVAVLVELAGVDDVQQLASQQFRAKSKELAFLSAEQLVGGDQKVFTYQTDRFEGSVAFAVVETTDDEVILRRAPELLAALAADKEAKGVSLTFLAVVNIVALKSTLLCVGDGERSLAQAAFAHGRFLRDEFDDEDEAAALMDLGGLVSRKKDFVPAVSAAIKRGWAAAPVGRVRPSKSDVFDLDKFRDD